MFWYSGQEEKNFDKLLIQSMIFNLNIPNLNYYIQYPANCVEIYGNIHRSQWTSDNPDNHYWLKVSVKDEFGFPVIGLKTLHIFLCFRIQTGPIYSYGNFPSKCIIPEPKNQTDQPNISNLFGDWEVVSWSNGPSKQINPNYKRASKEKLNKMKAKSSTSPAALEMMRKLKEIAAAQKN